MNLYFGQKTNNTGWANLQTSITYRLHTGDMPYKCSECDFASVYKDKYNTHVKIHLRAKGMTEEEANTTLYYYCDKCGKQFTNQYREA